MSGTTVTREGLEAANRECPKASAYWPTTDPEKEGDALGKIPKTGVLVFESTLAATLDFFVWSEISQRWNRPGHDTADYSVTFGASPAVPAQEKFVGCPGQKYFIKSSAAENAGYDNGEPV